jgi:hypothetical protein
MENRWNAPVHIAVQVPVYDFKWLDYGQSSREGSSRTRYQVRSQSQLKSGWGSFFFWGVISPRNAVN